MTSQPEETKPLKVEDKKEDKIVDLNLDDPHDPIPPTKEQVIEIESQQQEQKKADESAIESKEEEDKDWAKEVGVACNKGYNWFPITIFAWCSGWLLIACCIGDMIVLRTDFIAFWLYVYLICGALFILIIDLPYFIVSKFNKITFLILVLNGWIKLFSRRWGRCILYCIVMWTCASFTQMNNGQDEDQFRSVPWIAGIYLLIIIILSLIFSKLAAIKYIALRQYIIKSTDATKSKSPQSKSQQVPVTEETSTDQKDDEKESLMTDNKDTLRDKFAAKFDELDIDKTGQIKIKELSRLGMECGNTLSNSEKQVIFVVLDAECKGYIDKEQWVQSWMENEAPHML